jgi:hypothetical protein
MPVARQSKTTGKKDFFISRNKADQAWAVWIAWQLEKAGYSVIVQDWDFGTGSNFVLKMHEAIANSHRTIGVLSSDFLRSKYTASEWAAAFAEDPTGANQKIVLVKVRRCTPTGLLSQIVRIDLMGLDEAAAKQKLLAEIKTGRTKPTTAPAFPGKPSSRKPPFPGRAKAAVPKTTAKPPAKPPLTKKPQEAPALVKLTAKEAAEKIDQHRWGASKERNWNSWSMAWLGAVLVPGNQGAPYVDILELGSGEFQEKMRSLALVGTTAILRSDRGTKPDEDMEHLSLTQVGDGMSGLATVVEIHSDGTLVYRLSLGERAKRSVLSSRSAAHGQIIEASAVRSAIGAFVRFGNAFYRQRRRDPGTVYLGASLSGIQHQYFGQPPAGEVGSFLMANHNLEDPLHVPTNPLTLTAEERRAADAVAKKIVDHFMRRFRLAKADYPPSGRS